MSRDNKERALGMDSNITRRDFLNGIGMAVGATFIGPDRFFLETFGVPDSVFAPEKDPGYYPPAKTGLRGSHIGSFEVAHSLRDGKKWPEAREEKETYDLIVVGGGMSGLSAAIRKNCHSLTLTFPIKQHGNLRLTRSQKHPREKATQLANAAP